MGNLLKKSLKTAGKEGKLCAGAHMNPYNKKRFFDCSARRMLHIN